MKRITVISALCLAAIAVSAGPAAAASPQTFSATVGEGQSVSLLASTSACHARPCTYVWNIDGVRAGSSRSLVVTLAPGCHEVVLRMSERRFRNPTPARLRVARTVCIAEGDAAASTVGELTEPAPVTPAEDAPGVDEVDETGGEVTDPADVPPSETDATVVTDTATTDPPPSAPPTEPAPVETAPEAPPAETTSDAPPAETPPADTPPAETPPADASTAGEVPAA